MTFRHPEDSDRTGPMRPNGQFRPFRPIPFGCMGLNCDLPNAPRPLWVYGVEFQLAEHAAHPFGCMGLNCGLPNTRLFAALGWAYWGKQNQVRGSDICRADAKGRGQDGHVRQDTRRIG